MKNFILALFGLALGFAAGLAYAWLVAPVKYVDASPDLLRADFKDQYRIVIAASYAASRDLARARARLELLSAANPLGELNAQAQRMVGSGDPTSIELLVQLASDFQKGATQLPVMTNPPAATNTREPIQPPALTSTATRTPAPSPSAEIIATPTLFEGATPIAPLEYTLTPRPTPTVNASGNSKPFILVGQDEVCDPGIQPGLMQFKLVDSRRRQLPGIEIIVISTEGEDHFFTGFKPEVGDGYADFVMQENVSYSVRIGENGTFITNLTAPSCTDPNGVKTLGGLSLSFQQP